MPSNEAPLTTDERPLLHLKDTADFEIDRDGDLCIEIVEGYDIRRTWLTRPEADQLRDWLNKVLT